MGNEMVTIDGVTGHEVSAPAQQQEYAPCSGAALSYWSSLKPQTNGEKAILFQAIDGDCKSFNDLVGQQINVIHVVMRPATTTDDETGEVRDGTRIVLIDDKGQCYAGMSEGVLNSLRSLSMAFGPPPWAPPMPVNFRQIPLNGNRRMFKLGLAPEAFERQPQRGNGQRNKS